MTRTVGNSYAIVLDTVSLAIGIYGAYDILYSGRVLPDHLVDAGHWQFLTNLSLAYSLVVFALGLVAHVTRSQFLFRLKNNLHPIALALEAVVAVVYWPLRLFFLKLLVKDPSKILIPMLTDLSIHLMPVTSLLIDYLAFMPSWTLSRSAAFGACGILSTGYWFWLHHLIDFENGGEYPYAFLNHPSLYARIVIFGIVGLTGFSLYLFMSNVYVWVVGKQRED